jgi:elongation factor P
MDFSEIKLGSVVVYNNQPCVIIKCDFLRMQQRKPVKKCILKNLVTSTNEHYSFKSGESIEEAELNREKATFMYQSGDLLSFMITNSYETVEIESSILDDKTGYLKEGLEVQIVYFNDSPISIDLPIKIPFKVTQTSPAVKGNSVNSITKDATIETGKVIKVPAFITEGETIVVNTIEDEYVERYNAK